MGKMNEIGTRGIKDSASFFVAKVSKKLQRSVMAQIRFILRVYSLFFPILHGKNI